MRIAIHQIRPKKPVVVFFKWEKKQVFFFQNAGIGRWRSWVHWKSHSCAIVHYKRKLVTDTKNNKRPCPTFFTIS